MLSKLYIGNLPSDIDESDVRKLFEDHGLNVVGVLVKRAGYAFVDCPDQSAADRAIDKLNGERLFCVLACSSPEDTGAPSLTNSPSPPLTSIALSSGTLTSTSSLSQSPTVHPKPIPANLFRDGAHRTSGGKVLFHNVAPHVNLDDFRRFVATLGTVTECERFPGRNDAVLVSFETSEEAQEVVSQLDNYEYENCALHTELLTEMSGGQGSTGSGNHRNTTNHGQGRGGGGRMGGGPPGGRMGGSVPGPMGPGPGGAAPPARHTDFPLRILVLGEMVGAIIGRGGSTIRQVTQQTRARVDVHRKDNTGSLEKAITIYGNPENCSAACKKILEIMQQEANNMNKGDVVLKILAHNNLIGRIIGKGGNTIKKVMEDTNTRIAVSSINDINSFNLERVITIRGTIDNMSKAEQVISAKLRQSYENDLQAMAPQTVMFPGLHPMAMMSTLGSGYPPRPGVGMYGPSSGIPPYPPTYPPPPMAGGSGGGSFQAQQQETACLYIPNSAVGAIIGSKGSYVRSIMRFSGASVKIQPMNSDSPPTVAPPASPPDPTFERKVTVVGTPEAQWKAQFMVYEKMREEGFFSGLEEVRLTVEILVPSSQVGRIIGRGGNNVREMQRITGALVKLPEQGAQTSEETAVLITGSFYAVQSAQRRIRAMVAPAYSGTMRGNSGRGQGGPVPSGPKAPHSHPQSLPSGSAPGPSPDPQSSSQ
ncbi:unnamed protein product [Darwinula stevensoni]|uniref:RRM domain-containing protein n=1 Tax=Darwinula stevensoni TaxID=69355 RepID=A0A7R9FSL9_9CRUS|nr:unnamed protein product [Darwinula stevensoni]CAG0902912.1 unnamed protein product [Darwinula stevensoni]